MNCLSFDPADPEARYADDVLQTKLFEEELNARLRLLRDRARSNLNDRGVSTLFAAFGFLEWHDYQKPGRPLLAPCCWYRWKSSATGDRRAPSTRWRGRAQTQGLTKRWPPICGSGFDMLLPEFDDDDSPETYFAKVGVVCKGQAQWQVRRFLTLQNFSDAKAGHPWGSGSQGVARRGTDLGGPTPASVTSYPRQG